MFLKKMLIMAGAFVLAGVVNTYAGDISWYENNINSDEFEIYTANELKGLAELVNGDTSYGVVDFGGKTVELKNDIDLSEYENWEPIGNYETTENCFCGMFIGNEHTINNLTITKPSGYFVGLFGVVAYGSIERVNIDNVNISISELGFERDDVSGMAIGGLAGAVENATVMICENLGGNLTENCKDITANDNLAGLIGFSYGGYLCFNGNRASISVENASGAGIVCATMESTIGYSYNRGKITGGNSNIVAGICGSVGGEITDCYNNAEIASKTASKAGIAYNLLTASFFAECIDFYENESTVYCDSSVNKYLYNKNGSVNIIEFTNADVSEVVAYDMTTDEDEMLNYLSENGYYLSLRKAVNADNLSFWWEALYSDKKFYGDINCDGYFDDYDLALILKHISGAIAFDAAEKLQADIDENNAVNMLDAIKFKQEYL